ncbi:hypothetical protein BOKEGFJH_00250 [Chlamydia avium]|uniref:Uncharacterized protein n=2 Tax=Chlamydia avium TaxID=1457141 RepID=W8JLF7_9CHLA|nr:hypothetical protein [Chlamydia avium]AHK63129.1 Uncharacterized protein M832_02640 [Chlamydia avium 10DC88]EPP36823.1 hypothetical protein CP10743SC13_0582 [Chlamydia psittaci 10_743_SC13]EPP38050.1 hypothetical protein CP10881SC42_0665 [Chlamydia avium]VVT42738.1 hypothetical protein BOKEGFJH_00250 [Chlamydia avium]
MRILPFDPYGAIPPQKIQQDSKHHNQMTLHEKITDEIAKNEAIRLALLAISDQEQDRQRRQHRFKMLNKKQARVLLSQLRNLNLDFEFLTNPKSGRNHRDQQNEKNVSFKIAKGRKTFKIDTSAAKAIANAAEAWVIARNRGVLDMASLLFESKDDEV